MDLKKNYQELYKRWLKEINDKELSNFNQDDFIKMKEILSEIKALNTIDKNSIEIQLIEAYQKNISFMIEDFMAIRKLKIINSALMLKEIHLEKLIDTEKKLYQNLVSSFKGFDKTSSLIFSRDSIDIGKITLTTPESSSKNYEVESHPEIKENPITQTKSEIKLGALDESIEYEYTLIRVVKDAPELIGIDLKVYGPFQKEDIVNLPRKNARILVNEKFAEYFEVT
jgi:DNA replication initiation complex subunit (GINS family)